MTGKTALLQSTSERRRKTVCDCLSFAALAVFALVFLRYIIYIDLIPSGTDIWGHVYKAHYMYENLLRGNLFPLYDPNWYNGIETFRYWGPVSYYLYCIPLAVTGGQVILSYRLFLTLVVLLGGIPWVILGIRSGKRLAGTIIGIMWFMFPETLNVLLLQGNVPQITTIMITPYLILFLWLFLHEKRDFAAVGLTLTMSVMTVTHLMITGITGLSVFIFLLIDSLFNRDYKRKIFALLFMVCGILLMSAWVIPALSGGMIGSSDSGQSAASIYVTNLAISLNPAHRFLNGWSNFYIGLSFILLSVFGILASNRSNKAGFIYMLLVMVMTSSSASAFITKLPLSGLFWMERFTPVAYALFLLSFLEWDSIKKRFGAAFLALLLIDSAPFVAINGFSFRYDSAMTRDIDNLAVRTENRASLLDLSSCGPYASYAIPAAHKNYSFGWAWQGAATMDNIMLINEALENERFFYVFDRSLELGDDTILLLRRYVPSYAVDSMLEAASSCGYRLEEELETGYLFRLENPSIPDGMFGTVTTYPCISIGKYAPEMTTMYPAFRIGESNYIDEYSMSELCNYSCIFLSGFEYHDKETAEQLLEDLGSSGVRIVIDAAHLPTDPTTNEEYFFGVTASRIEFTNHFPALYYDDSTYHADDFNREYSSFLTSYISDIDNPSGRFYLGENELIFMGTTDRSSNIIFVGLNLMFHAIDMNDRTILDLYDGLLGIPHNSLPARAVVPVSYSFDSKSITIISEYDGVNTTLAWAECFDVDNCDGITRDFNLLTVNSGTTTIRLSYPMQTMGTAMGATGIVLTGFTYALFILLTRRRKKDCSR